MSYFNRSAKRRSIISLLEQKRVTRAGFRFPLGITPEEKYLPDEGYTLEMEPASSESQFGDRYFYCAGVSAEKVRPIFESLLGALHKNVCVIIERWSEDVNREKDVFISQELTLARVKRIFSHYDTLWLECGFVSFGIIDYDSGFEAVINDHKIIEVFTPYDYNEDVEEIFKQHGIHNEPEMTFSNNYDHWHSSLAGLVHEVLNDEDREYEFDYYDIINDLKVPLGLELAMNEDNALKVKPRWWYVVVKGVTKSGLKEFFQSFYLVAETEEEMETIVADTLERYSVGSYYLYDFCNVNPGSIDIDKHFTAQSESKFEQASGGIWALSDIMLVPRVKKRLSY
ncbi:MAG: hypothetical protein HZC28_08910 [Spirochaetes bacterium]|nr:hypothetical protein [Spirochaetota bacterium]